MPFSPVFQVMRVGYTLRDLVRAVGKTELFHSFTTSATIAAENAILTTMGNILDAMSNGANSAWDARMFPYPDPGAQGAAAIYPDSADKAVMIFATAKNQIVRVDLPAPKQAIFQPNGYSIDPTHPSVALFIATMTNGNWLSNAGDPITEYVRGFRANRKRGDKPAQLP